jgi:NAD(P)-dependent dehydrogenase (short-subunit alcohol dehydrogenase family)
MGCGWCRAGLVGIERVEIGQLDRLGPVSIDAFATRYLDSGQPLHILVNNAGIMVAPDPGRPRLRIAVRDQPSRPLPIDAGLLPALRAAHGARVVNVTSGGHRLSDIRWDDPQFTTGYDGMLAYSVRTWGPGWPRVRSGRPGSATTSCGPWD